MNKQKFQNEILKGVGYITSFPSEILNQNMYKIISPLHLYAHYSLKKVRGIIMRPIKNYETENIRFYKLPKELFLNPKYKNMSITAKVLYAFLYDRLSLSINNNWVNDENEVYIIFKSCLLYTSRCV